MRNSIFALLISLFYIEFAYSEDLFIESKNISVEKKNNLTIFKDDVFVKDKNNYQILSQYAELNNITKNLILKDKVKGLDNKDNKIETDYAEYNQISKIFTTLGPTKVTTSENYIIEGKDIVFNDGKKVIISDKNALITDNDGNKIYLDNFEYQIEKNIFKSIGYIKIQDKKRKYL